jgi:hypothetical protein
LSVKDFGDISVFRALACHGLLHRILQRGYVGFCSALFRSFREVILGDLTVVRIGNFFAVPKPCGRNVTREFIS